MKCVKDYNKGEYRIHAVGICNYSGIPSLCLANEPNEARNFLFFRVGIHTVKFPTAFCFNWMVREK